VFVRPAVLSVLLSGRCHFKAVIQIVTTLTLLAGPHISSYGDFRRHVREFFGAILDLVRPAVLCCFAVGQVSF
jgi:hypothetical protein